MIRKLLLLVAACSLVVALPSSADAALVDGVAAAAVSGTVALAAADTVASGGPCPDTTYTNKGSFIGLEMFGAFSTVTGTYVGEVGAGAPIIACIVGFVNVDPDGTGPQPSQPLVSEGDIRPPGTPGAFDDGGSPGVNGACLSPADIDRGSFVTAGIAAAVEFSVDYTVDTNCAVAGGDSTASNIPCLGAIAVAPNPLTQVSTIAGAIGCGRVNV